MFGKVVTVINTGVNPASVAVSPCGKFGYVSNNNNYSLPNQDTVTVFSTETNLPIKTIKHDSFNEPYTRTFNHKGSRAYVTNSGGSTISVIKTKTHEVTYVIKGFDGPSGMVIVGKLGYVNNYGATPGVGSGNGNTVSIVDLPNRVVIGDPIVVGLAPAAITANKKYVFTINYEDGNPNTGTISKIFLGNLKVTTIGPFSENGLSGPFAINLSEKYAYVTNFGSNNFTPFGTTLSKVDLRKGHIKETVELGIQPSGIALSSNGRFVLVSNYNTLYAYITPPPVQYLNLTPGQGTVNVVDLKYNKVVHTIAVGQAPSTVVVSPDGRHAYVTNYISNTVSVIKLSSVFRN